MTANTGVHTCSYYCERPECIKRQRDEMRDRMAAALAQQPAAVDGAMVELARKARQLQRDHFGDGMSLHLAMMGWAEEYDALATQHQEPTT